MISWLNCEEEKAEERSAPVADTLSRKAESR